MWDLPGPGIKPMSPALAGGFLTTGPPGKSQISKHTPLPDFCGAILPTKFSGFFVFNSLFVKNFGIPCPSGHWSLQSGCVSWQDHLRFRTARHGPCKWTACARRGGRRG